MAEQSTEHNFKPITEDSLVSVIIPTYDPARFDLFKRCVEHSINQTHTPLEIILVITPEIDDLLSDDTFSSRSGVDIVTVVDDTHASLAEARTLGAERASGDIYVFTDDDAYADDEWVEELVKTYMEEETGSVGGWVLPEWEVEKKWFPKELYWLVAVTGDSHPSEASGDDHYPPEGRVRNTWGPNISFRAELMDEIGGFNASLGKDHGHNLQGEETEVSEKINRLTNTLAVCNPSAYVHHRVDAEQLTFKWITDRAYWQGMTKAYMENELSNVVSDENEFLKTILHASAFNYLFKIKNQTIPSLIAGFLILYVISIVGIGFIYGTIKSKID